MSPKSNLNISQTQQQLKEQDDIKQHLQNRQKSVSRSKVSQNKKELDDGPIGQEQNVQAQQSGQNQLNYSTEQMGKQGGFQHLNNQQSSVKRLASSRVSNVQIRGLKNSSMKSQQKAQGQESFADIQSEESDLPQQAQIRVKLKELRKQLDKICKDKSNEQSTAKPVNQKQISEVEQQIQALQIRQRLCQKLSMRKQPISLQRINHLQHIFKHYCSHIFKTGKHMTFDRLQYEKVHLTIDRLFVFIKDFNLITMKMKDGKVGEIVDKQQIIKLFKKVSSNSRDLSFEQFIITIQKLGELYFDSKINYFGKKQNQRKERLKIKHNLQIKQKMKQQMMRRFKQKQQKLQKLQKATQQQAIQQQKQTQLGVVKGHQIQNMMGQLDKVCDDQADSSIQQAEKINQKFNQKSQKIGKPLSAYSKAFKEQSPLQKQKVQTDNLTNLTRQEKIQYFYEIINVDEVQSFTNKMRELNLPLFRTYGPNQNLKNKQLAAERPGQDRPGESSSKAKQQSQQAEDQDSKRLKQLRQKLYERSQKARHASVSNITRQECQMRKLKRSKIQLELYSTEQSKYNNQKSKVRKIQVTETEINLSSLSKLGYDSINFTKFNPKDLYNAEDDDRIYLNQYEQSPVKTRKILPTTSGGNRVPRTSKTMIQHKDKNPDLSSKTVMQQKEKKNSEFFLQRLKQRQSDLQISEKKQQVSQLYRLNDRTQRQRRLIDKFLDKNK